MIFEQYRVIDNELGFSWLPISTLNDVDNYKTYEEEEVDLRFASKRRSYDEWRYRPRWPPSGRKSSATGRFPLLTSQQSNDGLKPYPKLPKYPMAGGPGMQAIFIHSGGGKKSSGTGVFFPQVTTKKDGEFIKKSGFAPILLPARVVQVLNLNVHALSVQKKPQDIDNVTKHHRFRNKKINKMSSEISKIFLPKEWPY